MLNKFTKGLRIVGSILKHLKESSDAVLMRYFNKRKKDYDSLIKRLDSFSTELTASGGVKKVDVTEDIGGGKPGDKAANLDHVTVKYRDGAAIPLRSFVVPNRKELAEQVKILDEVELVIEELELMISRLSKKTDSASVRMVKEMTKYLDEIDKRAERATEALDEVYTKHVPESVEKMMVALMNHVNNTLPAETYSGMARDMHVTAHDALVDEKDAAIQFTQYLYIDGLDKDLFKTAEFILVLTSVVHESKRGEGRKGKDYYTTFHLTSINKFQRPGHFDIGDQLGGSSLNGLISSLRREATKLMSLHGLSFVVGKRSLKELTQQKLRTSGLLDLSYVSDVDVQDDEVLLHLAKSVSDKAVEEIWKEVIVLLRRVIRAPKNSSFAYVLERKADHTLMRVSNIKNMV